MLYEYRLTRWIKYVYLLTAIYTNLLGNVPKSLDSDINCQWHGSNIYLKIHMGYSNFVKILIGTILEMVCLSVLIIHISYTSFYA